MTKDHAVEIIGKVQADLSVRVLVSTNFGTGIGMFSFFFFLLALFSPLLLLLLLFYLFPVFANHLMENNRFRGV